jgi:molybdate transport system substrate-binding protein
VADLKNGVAADLVILSAEAIEDLIKQGTVVAGSRVDLGASGIGLAVRKGATKPDITTPEALKRTLLAARSIACSRQGLSGVYFPTVLERLGIAAEVRPKIVHPQSGPVGVVVANGEAELGVQQISELLPVPGIEIVGPMPGDLQKYTMFSAGLCTGARAAEGAKALVATLTAAPARPVFASKGLTPP